MKVIEELESMGYAFRVQGDLLHYVCRDKSPNVEQIRRLLEVLKNQKAEALAYLRQRPFTNRTKRFVIFPADSPLPFPVGSWQRLEDGRIEAYLSHFDMALMMYWREDVLAADDRASQINES